MKDLLLRDVAAGDYCVVHDGLGVLPAVVEAVGIRHLNVFMLNVETHKTKRMFLESREVVVVPEETFPAEVRRILCPGDC